MTAEKILRHLGDNGHDKPAIDFAEIDKMLEEVKFDLGCSPTDVGDMFFIESDGKKIAVGGRGTIGLVMGAEKSRKTNFLKSLVAAALSGEKFLNMYLDLPDETTAVYFDTEQPREYFNKTQFQAHILGKQVNNSPRYCAYQMRKWSTEQRILGIERHLSQFPVSLCIIDGLLDLVDDFNNIHESKSIVQRLMSWTELPSKPMILGVIHTNRGGKGYARNSMGMLGSMADKKCDFGIELTFDAKTGFSTVTHKLPRGKRFEQWEFTQNEEGYPVLNHLQKLDLPYPLNLDQQHCEIIPF